MSKLFSSDEEVGPEEAHRRAQEEQKAEAVAKAPAKKAPAKKAAAAGEHEPAKAAPAAKKTAAAVPAPRAATHTHEPVQSGSPTHPTVSKGTGKTLEHDQMLTVHILTHVPEHSPREDDPHYHLFEQAKSRLKRQGMWQCIINDDLCDGEPELHHTHVEFSQINQVDEKKIMQALGLHFETDEDFQKWAESPGNLEVLCANHHRAHYGIHVIPGPLWEALRFHKTGTGPAAEFVPASQVEADGAGSGDDEKKPAAKKAAAK
ncbi:hypothetical protein KGQ20_15940 [Catenulispora sp. NF23]|uniref:HNH nuclease domain-containing protein n=1 Tax=Catenulispora pinistramenti TaxID=2705254 RepID=A0ABS5KXS3_9ACTN|nr:hypothetical protein [Catenulispora pinistramenti]MBS2534262.1 hypothetical protein [Catenulispora pinistramenti]MBS2550810.1 hypothetical protein [Catenulispora pinistramenti]